jgi:glycosyltransferase involved in cell wall biosynthesis
VSGFLRTFADDDYDLQHAADVAVVIPTILRPLLSEALQSVFEQTLQGRIQVLIGVDKPVGDLAVVSQAVQNRPRTCAVQVFYPGYSTSVRHGGLSPAQDGGALRTILTYLANSPYVAYLDDDNWWHPDHLAALCRVIGGADWAFAKRWFVDPLTRDTICVDEWESVGPGKGIFLERFGGFVDPSCLMINKLRCAEAIPLWRLPLVNDLDGRSADRTVFDVLRRYRGSATDTPSVYYQIDTNDGMHADRARRFQSVAHCAGAIADAALPSQA